VARTVPAAVAAAPGLLAESVWLTGLAPRSPPLDQARPTPVDPPGTRHQISRHLVRLNCPVRDRQRGVRSSQDYATMSGLSTIKELTVERHRIPTGTTTSIAAWRLQPHWMMRSRR
jgi:hypothetical protein